MKGTRLALLALVGMLCVSPLAAQGVVTVYSHDFETLPGPEWSKRVITVNPYGDRSFLGEFSGEPVVLGLHDLGDHCRVTVSFDLYIIDTWEGSVGWNAGPDVWDLNVSSGSPWECPLENLIHTTFANCECDYQAYPDNFPAVHNRGYTDAAEVDTLGYYKDSVYHLVFSFYHDAEDLYFTFQGSPDLEGVLDESWGIDNIRVQLDPNAQYCCRAYRNLPVGYGVGHPATVNLGVRPDPRSQAHVVEETPPVTWTVAAVNNGGFFDAATGKVKWGPFFDTQRRVLAYTVIPPAGASGPYTFDGIISVDGVSEPICGQTALDAGSFHPADIDDDWDVDANEFTAYAAAWAKGDPWTNNFDPITANYVTNAGFIWRSGETYTFAGDANPPWVPAAGPLAQAGHALAVASPTPYGLMVTVKVTPVEATRVWALEEAPPAGWTVSSVGTGGRIDQENGHVKWGPYTGSQPRALTYAVAPVAGSAGVVGFKGFASFDGVGVEVERQSLAEMPETSAPVAD